MKDAKKIDAKKIAELAELLDVELTNIKNNGDNYFQIGNEEYLVLDEDEKELKLHDEISEELWAFNAEFIMDTCGIPMCEGAEKSLGKMLGNECEGANDFVRALIDGTCGIDEFIDAAVEADGAGQFLSSYDGNEIELRDGYYAYQV